MTSLETTPRSGADTFARYAMITCAWLSPLLLAAALLLSPMGMTTDDSAYVREFAANLDAYPLSAWMSALSAITLIPALLGVGRVARRGKPVLGLVGLILGFVLALPIAGNTDDALYAGLKSGVDEATMTKIYVALMNDVPTAVLGMTWFVGLLGVVLLGLAALLGKSAPTWGAVALIAAPILVPVPWVAGLPMLAAGAAWLVLAAGLGGVALGLLREPA